MKRLAVICSILLLGAGCTLPAPRTEVPTGYTKYDDGTLQFIYPSDLTVNTYNFKPDNFDFTSNIYIAHTNVTVIEDHCWEMFGYRYAQNPSEKPIAKGLAVLADKGFGHSTAKEVGRDVWDCGNAWGSYEKFPVSVGEYNGVIDYGCAGNSGLCTPDFNWVNVTLVNRGGDVYLISFRPIFGNLKDRDLTMFVETDSDWDKVATATHAALTNGYNYNENSPAVSWFDDLVANIGTIDQIISTIQVSK